MMSPTLLINIVSAEKQIFAGEAEMVFATGIGGELGIAPGHAPLLTALKPGNVKILLANKEEEIFYVSSGMLEVQPFVVTVLADTAVRADDIDEAIALAAKEKAEKEIASRSAEVDIARAMAELAEALAQIRAVQGLRKRSK